MPIYHWILLPDAPPGPLSTPVRVLSLLTLPRDHESAVSAPDGRGEACWRDRQTYALYKIMDGPKRGYRFVARLRDDCTIDRSPDTT